MHGSVKKLNYLDKPYNKFIFKKQKKVLDKINLAD